MPSPLTTADAACVLFITATGLRPQEWQVLRWLDLEIAGRACRVQRTFSGGVEKQLGKSSAALRTVVLQLRALDALAMIRARSTGTSSCSRHPTA